MKPENTAVIWIDPDNEFLHARGKLHGAVKTVLEANHVVENINRVSQQARNHGAQTFFVPIAFSDDYREMGDEPQGILAVVKEAGALKRDTWGTQVAEGLDVEEGDIVIEGKSTTCAFASTNLDDELKRRGITHVAIGGLLTNACVESTLRSAYDKGYTVYALTDCSATLSPESHQASIEHSWPLFSTPMTHDAFAAALAPVRA